MSEISTFVYWRGWAGYWSKSKGPYKVPEIGRKKHRYFNWHWNLKSKIICYSTLIHINDWMNVWKTNLPYRRTPSNLWRHFTFTEMKHNSPFLKFRLCTVISFQRLSCGKGGGNKRLTSQWRNTANSTSSWMVKFAICNDKLHW